MIHDKENEIMSADNKYDGGWKPQTAPENSTVYTDEEAARHAAEAGIKARPAETLNEIDKRGAFIRQKNHFITPFGDKEGDLKAEAGRYRIIWAKGCNWSNRPVIARDLLGLKDVIGDELVYFTGETNIYGKGFSQFPDHRDPVSGAYFISEFYKNGDPEYKGRATTPALVDINGHKTVNSDYHRMSNYIEVQFRKFQPKDAPDLYPKKYRGVIDDFNDWLFPHVNNGGYRMGFCQSWTAYSEAFDDFYASMDKLEKRLSENRFLFGDYVTDSDIRFFVTLARWDLSYFRKLGPVKHRIVDYENIWGYARELYAIPAFRDNTYLRDFAKGRDGDRDKLFADWNSRIATQIDLDEYWKDDGRRAELSSHPDQIFLSHPEDETPEDYQSEISFCRWNRQAWEDRDPSSPANNYISVDPEINPLKGLL